MDNNEDGEGRPGLRHRFRSVLKKRGDSSQGGRAGRTGRTEHPERLGADGAAGERDQATRFEIVAMVQRRAIRAGFPGARPAYGV